MNKYLILFVLCFVFASESNNKFDWKMNLIPIVGQIKNGKYVKAGILSQNSNNTLHIPCDVGKY